MARQRRPRSARESLLSIALGLEAIVVFFLTLTAFGLRAVPAPVAFGAGGALLLALVVAAGLQRYRWAHWIGWALQVVLIATGFVLPAMFVVGAGFAALWTFCYVKSRQIEGRGTLPEEETA